MDANAVRHSKRNQNRAEQIRIFGEKPGGNYTQEKNPPVSG